MNIREQEEFSIHEEFSIREAKIEDASEILAVYRPYILNTTITYEYDVPTVEEFAQRMHKILGIYPYYVCEYKGDIVGYAYASRHQERAAFAWGAEVSIYLKEGIHGKGVAMALYDILIEQLYRQGIYKVYALIDSPNEKSENFHLKRGFKKIGHLPRTAFKLGRWCDLAYYEKELRCCEGTPIAFIPVSQLQES